jgi:hypothetical protein
MKKTLIILLSAVMLMSAAACHGQNGSSSSSSASSGETTSAGSSSAASGTSSSVSLYSGVTVSGAVSKPPVVIKKSPYTVKTVDYKYTENNRNYRASYPQLSSDSVNCDAVNALLKKTALQTVNSLGTSKASKEVKVKVSDHVSCKEDNFISVTFRETVDKSDGNDSVSYFRTVNYDLKNKKAVSVTDMVQKNSALLTALQNAVKKQMSEKKAANYTAAVLQSGMQNCSIYFKDDSLGVSIPVSHALNDHEELIVDYDKTSGFKTSNAAWGYFIKK